MRSIFLSSLVVILFFSVISDAYTQGGVAVPFLLVSSSPDGNGWGGIGTAVVFDNPMGTTANPAQLGMFKQPHYYAVSSYTTQAHWLPSFPYSDVGYSVFGASAGFTFNKIFPGGARLGIGYLRTSMKNTDFIWTTYDGIEMGIFEAKERSEQLSIGFGTTYYARVGIGMNFKSIFSRLSPHWEGSAVAKKLAFDFGLLVQVPTITLIEKINDNPLFLFDKVQPLADITFGYTRNNMGGNVTYIDESYGFPLPLRGTLGLSMELGATMNTGNEKWRIISFTWAREAGDLLARRLNDNEFEYKSGIAGDVSFFDNVLFGKPGDVFEQRKGWQLNFGEIVFLRGGSHSYKNNPHSELLMYTTSGFGLRLRGIFKLIDAFNVSIDSPVFLFIRDHIDIQFDHAVDKTDWGSVGRGKFNALTLVVR